MANCARYEPTIDEILADPTVHALMRADRVNPDRLRSKLLQHMSISSARMAGSTRQGAAGVAASATAAKPLPRQVWG